MEITNIIQIITIFNLLLSSTLIIIMRKKLNESIFLFSLFLLGLGVTLIGDYLFANMATIGNKYLMSLANILNSFYFFYAPFLYFFALSISGHSAKRRDKLIHFIPFKLFLLYNIALVGMYLLDYYTNPFFDFLNTNIPKVFYVYFIQVIIYTIISFKIISRSLSESSSKSINGRRQKKIVLMYVVVWFFFLLAFISDVFLNEMKTSVIFKFFAILFLLILSNLSLFMLLKTPEVFFNQFSWSYYSTNKIVTKSNYLQLCEIVKSNELFKNTELKVADVSKQMGISSRNISTLIKSFHGTNFNDYINSYRVEEAKRLLRISDMNVTILSILYDSGFNSKSVFNNTFKKIEGVTPTEYRKQVFSSNIP